MLRICFFFCLCYFHLFRITRRKEHFTGSNDYYEESNIDEREKHLNEKKNDIGLMLEDIYSLMLFMKANDAKAALNYNLDKKRPSNGSRRLLK